MKATRRLLIVVALVPAVLSVLALATYGILNVFWGPELPSTNPLIRCNPNLRKCPEPRRWTTAPPTQTTDVGPPAVPAR